jgi:hypothetical protein
MAAAPEVAVVGMGALRRDLARLGADTGPLNRQLAAAGRRAIEPVAEAARSAVPKNTGTLAGDIRVSGTKSGATVRMGRAKIPYAGPVEFGGWPPGRPFVKDGRYLFPAARALAGAAATEYAPAVQAALDAFDWSNVTGDPAAVRD